MPSRVILFQLVALHGAAAALPAAVIGTEFPVYPASPGSTITVNVLVSGGGNVQAGGVCVFIGDGGPTFGGVNMSPPAPIITNISVTAPGTIFASNNTGSHIGVPLPDLIAVDETTTASGLVNADSGRLGVVTIQIPANAPPAVWRLSFYDGYTYVQGPSGIPPIQYSGAWISVPEPSADLLFVGSIAAYASFRRREKKPTR